jgi:hypothetical protein
MTTSNTSPLGEQKQLRVTHVLLEHDGPAVFISQVGFFEVLFYKIDELDEVEVFLATPLQDGVAEMLRSGHISIRAAIESSQNWVVKTTPDLTIVSVQPPTVDNVLSNEDDLPARRIGLSASFKKAADSLEEATALFAMSFRGSRLGRYTIPVGIFTTLLAKTIEASRDILIPTLLSGSRTATLDFEMTEPKFGSLIIALQAPILNTASLEKKFKERIDHVDVDREIRSNGLEFVASMEELTDAARRGNIGENLIQEKFAALDQSYKLMPSDQSMFDELSITSNSGQQRSVAVIEAEVGEKLRAARERAAIRPVVDHGKIITINAKRKWIVYQSIRGREVTIYPDNFKELRREAGMELGSSIRVRGRLHRRKRRDLIDAESIRIGD